MPLSHTHVCHFGRRVGKTDSDRRRAYTLERVTRAGQRSRAPTRTSNNRSYAIYIYIHIYLTVRRALERELRCAPSSSMDGSRESAALSIAASA